MIKSMVERVEKLIDRLSDDGHFLASDLMNLPLHDARELRKLFRGEKKLTMPTTPWVYEIGWSSRRDPNDHDKTEVRWMIYRMPLHVSVIDSTVDNLCALTRHLFCNSRAFHAVLEYTESHTERLYFPADHEVVAKYHQWRHGDQPYWMDDDD